MSVEIHELHDANRIATAALLLALQIPEVYWARIQRRMWPIAVGRTPEEIVKQFRDAYAWVLNKEAE